MKKKHVEIMLKTMMKTTTNTNKGLIKSGVLFRHHLAFGIGKQANNFREGFCGGVGFHLSFFLFGCKILYVGILLRGKFSAGRELSGGFSKSEQCLHCAVG